MNDACGVSRLKYQTENALCTILHVRPVSIELPNFGMIFSTVRDTYYIIRYVKYCNSTYFYT